jgi:hypothetical protein
MRFDGKVNQILEMYLNLDTKGELYPRDPNTYKIIKSDSFPIPEQAKLIDSIDEHDIYQLIDGDWFELFVKAKQEKDACIRMAGTILNNASYQEREVDASKTNTFPVVSLYQYLILNRNIKLITDNEHSIGGKSIWLKLLQDPRIKFFTAIENKLNDSKVEAFSEWIPLKKSEIKNPLQFWHDNSRTSRIASTVFMAVKK